MQKQSLPLTESDTTKKGIFTFLWPKLRYIYLRFLVIAGFFIVGYTFLNWALVIETGWLPVYQDVANIWLPLLLSWVPVLIWLRPVIRLLKLKGANDNKPFLYTLFAVAAIAVPTIIAQFYVTDASGELKKFYSIEQISQRNPSRHYIFRQYYIDKKFVGIQTTYDVSGKYNEDFNMHIYVAAPILVDEADTIYSSCLGWLGFVYHDRISNRLDDNEKDAKFTEFVERSQADFETREDVSKFTYIKRIGFSEDADAFQAALRNSPKSSAGPLEKLVFLPMHEPFEERTGNKLLWFTIILTIALIGWLVMVILPQFDEDAYKRFKSGLGFEHEEDSFDKFLIPKGNWFITPIVGYLNIIVFFIMVFAGLGFVNFDAYDLLVWGGNFRPAIMHGQWWRLVSSMFLHGGIIHLVGNLYGLILVGIFLEPVLGRAKYLLTYLLTGILASCASIWWHEATVSSGASGAIFGLYGMFLALYLRKVYTGAFKRVLLINILIFVGYNLIMGFGGGIDNAAHIGGLLSGFTLGFILKPRLEKTDGAVLLNNIIADDIEPLENNPGIMTRADYVGICRKCKNNELDLDVGIICALTKKKADFDKVCQDYIG